MATHRVVDVSSDWVTVQARDGREMRLPWEDLREAASEHNAEDLRALYVPLLKQAMDLVRHQEHERRTSALQRFRACDHVGLSFRDVAFSGPVSSRNENRAAHGCICRIERCHCGAEKRTNINGIHTEVGSWRLDLDEMAR